VEVAAIVRGSEIYEVSLQWENPRLFFYCDCPYFEEHSSPCKHLWATILSAQQAGHLSEVSSEADVALRRETFAFAQGDFPVGMKTRGRGDVGGIRTPPPPRPPAWKEQLNQIAMAASDSRIGMPSWPKNSEVIYIVETSSYSVGSVSLTLARRKRGKDGATKSRPKPCSIRQDEIVTLPTQEDREILSMLLGAGSYGSYGSYQSFFLYPSMTQVLLPQILRTGRCFLPFATGVVDQLPLWWNGAKPWRLVLKVERSGNQGWRLTGDFRRGEEGLPLKEPLLAVAGSVLVTSEWVAPLEDDHSGRWITLLRKSGSIVIPEEDRGEFLAGLLGLPAAPPLELPEEWRYEEIFLSPRPCLKISRPARLYGRVKERMPAELSFEYGDFRVLEREPGRGRYDAATRRFLHRDNAFETAAATLLQELGLRCGDSGWREGWDFAPAKLPQIVRELTARDWHVLAEGKVFRSPGKSSVSVASGVDWFELQGAVEYGETIARLPRLLAALKKGETMVLLDDGSYGLLPEEWLRRFHPVAELGEAGNEHIRFRSSQAGMLDALLVTQPEVGCDETFRRVREELARFTSIGPAEQPAGFQGTLREYQREGVGWMNFLRQFSFGGCLADDMGVGKTAQVLAVLESRRELRAESKVDAPSLVVVPKSLIFNWKQEIQRFTPQLRVLDYTGIARSKDEFADYDVILTTYGTLRRDALHFKDRVFDYLILDEAQAIKNAKTESAKAVRLLRGNYRLALSGTPVENHLGELWSLFEFLNPGMLGSFGAFAGASKQNLGEETRRLLAHALRPFLLRRTKEQVAKELPAKIEQTIYCELEAPQRALYNELRHHYREALLRKIGSEGIGKSKIQVLEALLRLRQAACHPGLVDRKRVTESSAKLEVLLEQLRSVLDEGHKALIFSQFTSLLGILRAQLSGEGIEYEYLDGKTADREARVQRFQHDCHCQLFLISLKAGGVGLNLTAADYVFILDPWWNPAVEAQAVDRTHRIGQVKQVFAYRLIARDTVEEKILKLQETKRNLADAIIGAENSLIRDLTREDIELLLS